MKDILTPEALAIIAKMLLEYGMPGIIIMFLLEDRRRLLKEVRNLQSKYSASLEARIQTSVDALTAVKDNENAIDKMTNTLNMLMIGRNRRDGND